MSLLTLIPDELSQTISFRTVVLTSRDGSEQRIATRTLPRHIFDMNFLADSDLEIQYWKHVLATDLATLTWEIPLWAEAEEITVPIQVSDTTVDADFTMMDTELTGIQFLVLHTNGVTTDLFTSTSRTSTQMTRLTGTFTDAFPVGSLLVPVEYCYTENNTSYSPFIVNAASMSAKMTTRYNKAPGGLGAPAITTYNGRNVLDRRPLSDGGNEVFSQRQKRLDFGGRVQIESAQTYANINSGRSYLSTTREDRQWWKSFLASVNGSQKSFYCSTYRHDMTVTVQPSVGGTTFDVDAASWAESWDDSMSHLHLAITTADGVIQYKEIDPATTDNTTITITTGLTATVDGSTIVKVSFLELVRFGTDDIVIQHNADRTRIVEAPIRTIQA